MTQGYQLEDYPVLFPSVSTLTWDTFLTLRGTWGFYLKYSHPDLLKVIGWGGGVVVGCGKILVSAPALGADFELGLTGLGLGWVWGRA